MARNWCEDLDFCTHATRSGSGQKCPKRLRLPTGKNTHEHMDRIVPGTDMNARLVGHVKSEFCFEVIDRVVFYDWNSDLHGEGNVVRQVTAHPRIERKK